jgi:sec-independent protein translocase protein TatA
MFGLGPVEIVVIGAIAVMLYGKRLPEVGRSVGQGIGELRKTFNSISRDIELSSTDSGKRPASRRRIDDDSLATSGGTSFDPPPE